MGELTGLWKLFSTFLVLGVQSFGGGSSTFALIHQACIKNGWLSEEAFTRDWALAQISPGINLVKLSILIGHQLRGWAGLLAAMAGLLLPSSIVTVLMTVGLEQVRSQPLVQAAMRGILPATLGLSLSMAFSMGQPIFKKAYGEGTARLGLHALILVSAALLMAGGAVSPVLILLLSGSAAMLALVVLPARARVAPPNVEEEGA